MDQFDEVLELLGIKEGTLESRSVRALCDYSDLELPEILDVLEIDTPKGEKFVRALQKFGYHLEDILEILGVDVDPEDEETIRVLYEYGGYDITGAIEAHKRVIIHTRESLIADHIESQLRPGIAPNDWGRIEPTLDKAKIFDGILRSGRYVHVNGTFYELPD